MLNIRGEWRSFEVPSPWSWMGLVHEPGNQLPEHEEGLNHLMVRDEELAVFRYAPRNGTNVMSRLRTFYAIGPDYYYRMYLDLDQLPIVLWS